MNYFERCKEQMLDWAKGKSIHNRIDDECCPDFSCCQSYLFEKDEAKRWEQYHKKYGQKQ